MKTYTLLFRMDITTPEAQPNAEQMTSYRQQWAIWIKFIDDAGQLAPGGNHFSRNGRVLHADQSVVDSPYSANNTSVAGYINVFAKDIDDVTRIVEKCPVLNGENTSVEIREIA